MIHEQEQIPWLVMVENSAVVFRAWPWVCGTAFTNLLFCGKWRWEYLMLLAWPVFVMIGCMMAIMVMTLPLVVFERVWTPVVARRVCWVVFVAVDVLVLLIILRDAANPAIHLFPKR